MDALFAPLANATGASLDQLKVRTMPGVTVRCSLDLPQLIICLLVSYPLGSLFIRIPNDRPNLKHLFNVAITTFYLIPMLNLWTGTLQLLLDIVGTYVIASKVKTSNMPWIVFTYVSLLLSFCSTSNPAQVCDGTSYDQVSLRCSVQWSHLSCSHNSHSHIIRAVFQLSYETFEVTGPQMVLTMKLTTFAWNVYDGRRPVEVCCPLIPNMRTGSYKTSLVP